LGGRYRSCVTPVLLYQEAEKAGSLADTDAMEQTLGVYVVAERSAKH
jgi:hypothetical protein